MILNESDRVFKIKAESYEVEFDFVRLLAVVRIGPDFYYGFCPLGAVDPVGGSDSTSGTPSARVVFKSSSSVKIEMECKSSAWESETRCFEFRENEIESWTRIRGHGRVDRACFFRGDVEGNELASVPGFTQIFSPLPNFIEKQEFHVNEYIPLAAGNTPEALASLRGFGLHGSPLCFVFHEGEEGPFLAAGALAKPGELNFHSFEINHRNERFLATGESIVATQALSFAYYGQLEINGEWESPRVVLIPASGREDALSKYLNLLKKQGGFIERKAPYEDWTFKPVYCTWHDQVAIALSGLKKSNISFRAAESGAHAALCTQENCERWLSLLESHDAKPGTFIIDAKWQTLCGDPASDETKFPNLRAFVDSCHAKGIRVVLWFNGWDKEGLPDSECLRVDGKAVAPDPMNPSYRSRAARFMKRMLSGDEGCYNADGLKVDGMTGTPFGYGLESPSGLAGFELARALLELLYSEAKKIKKDCAIGQFTAFPYFADLCDFARTGDLYTVKGDPVSANKRRVWIQRLVMPEVSIDTDGAQRFNCVYGFDEVNRKTPAGGTPCAYQAELLLQRRDYLAPLLRSLNAEDYASIAKLWKERGDRASVLKRG